MHAAIGTYLLVCLSVLNVLEGKVGFPKDMSMNVVFPPIITPSQNNNIKCNGRSAKSTSGLTLSVLCVLATSYVHLYCEADIIEFVIKR
jgi:hypothetical protein